MTLKHDSLGFLQGDKIDLGGTEKHLKDISEHTGAMAVLMRRGGNTPTPIMAGRKQQTPKVQPEAVYAQRKTRPAEAALLDSLKKSNPNAATRNANGTFAPRKEAITPYGRSTAKMVERQTIKENKLAQKRHDDKFSWLKRTRKSDVRARDRSDGWLRKLGGMGARGARAAAGGFFSTGVAGEVAGLAQAGGGLLGGVLKGGKGIGKFLLKNPIGRMLTMGGLLMGAGKAFGADGGESDKDGQKQELSKGVGGLLGGGAGWMGGAAAGAAIGSVVPVIGTAMGGLIGAVVGGIGGDMIGENVGEWLYKKDWKGAWDKTRTKLSTSFGWMTVGISGMASTAWTGFSAIWPTAAANIEATFTLLKDGFLAGATVMFDGITSGWAALKKMWSDANAGAGGEPMPPSADSQERGTWVEQERKMTKMEKAAIYAEIAKIGAVGVTHMFDKEAVARDQAQLNELKARLDKGTVTEKKWKKFDGVAPQYASEDLSGYKKVDVDEDYTTPSGEMGKRKVTKYVKTTKVGQGTISSPYRNETKAMSEADYNAAKAYQSTETKGTQESGAYQVGRAVGAIGGKPTKGFTKDKAASIARVAQNIGVDPNDLAAVISFESAGSFNPSIKNPGSSATGLIQFMKGTDGHNGYYGMSRERFSGLGFDEQMNYVEKYYKNRGFKAGNKKSLGDVYGAVTGYGYKKGSKAYEQNKVWDSNGNGVVEKGEMVQNKAFAAHRRNYFGGLDSTGASTPTQKASVVAKIKVDVGDKFVPKKVAAVSTPKITLPNMPEPIKMAAIEVPKNTNQTIKQLNNSNTKTDSRRNTTQSTTMLASQDVSDRLLAHVFTGGIGSSRA